MFRWCLGEAPYFQRRSACSIALAVSGEDSASTALRAEWFKLVPTVKTAMPSLFTPPSRLGPIIAGVTVDTPPL